MKFKYKKYLYIVNDITNILLKKELVEREEEAIYRLKKIITFLSILLFLSIILSLFLYFR